MSFLHLTPSPPPPLPKPSQTPPTRKPTIHLSSIPSLSPLTNLHAPPAIQPAENKPHQTTPPFRPPPPPPNGQNNEFYLNLGVAVCTLRDDLPSLFSQDLNYDIYREDITFIDPLNTFRGMENYRLIFWALRFHGRILFREIGVEVFRVWQPSENSIWIRWELRGVPRVPWEAVGRFQGTSRYKIDRNGKIYEHKVDNLSFNLPQRVMRSSAVLDFVTAGCPPSPNLTFLGDMREELGTCSWIELYRAVRGAVVLENQLLVPAGISGLVGCS